MLTDNIFKKIFAVSCYFIFSGLFFVGLIGLLLSSTTWQTALFCITFLYFLSFPILFILNGEIKKKHFIIFGLFFIILFCLSFKLNYKKDNKYELVCINKCIRYNWNLLNIVNEQEYLNTGFRLGFLLGISNKQLESFKYRVLQYEKEVKIELPSHIPRALLNINSPSQYLLYKPEKNSTKKVFFIIHGNAGGFQFYQKFFKQFADSENATIVEPLFGWGNWDEKGGINLIYDTYNDLAKKGYINKNTEVSLFGISNGGKGLSRTVYFDDNNLFSKIIYISGIIEPEIIKSNQFQKNSENKKFFVIHGKIDDRTLYSNFLLAKNYFKNLKNLIFEDGDHFLLLNKEKEVVDEIYRIIKS